MSATLTTIDSYMTRDVITFTPGEDIHTALKRLVEKRISGAPVVDRNAQLVGMLTKKDCFAVVYGTAYHQQWGGQVRDYMSRDVQTIETGTDIVTAADRFLHTSFHRFPVTDRGRMVGLISRHDILVALDEHWGG